MRFPALSGLVLVAVACGSGTPVRFGPLFIVDESDAPVVGAQVSLTLHYHYCNYPDDSVYEQMLRTTDREGKVAGTGLLPSQCAHLRDLWAAVEKFGFQTEEQGVSQPPAAPLVLRRKEPCASPGESRCRTSQTVERCEEDGWTLVETCYYPSKCSEVSESTATC